MSKSTVIVVDNGSTDDTGDVAKEFGATIVYEPRRGIGSSRQTGLEAVSNSAKMILTTNADTAVSPNWIGDHVKRLTSSAVYTFGDVVYRPDNSENVTDTLYLMLYNTSAHHVHRIKNYLGALHSNAGNSGFNKDLALSVGGYDRNLSNGENVNLMYKLSRTGEVIYLPETRVYSSARKVLSRGINGAAFMLTHNMIHLIAGKPYSNKDSIDVR